MMKYPKRLIEVDLPIRRISAHARREKSIRHGHISTLHIWWARRPLAACRAVICASLWPDPVDELCPPVFREAAVEQVKAFANRVFPRKITEEGRLLSSEKHLSPESRGRWEAIAQGTLTLDPAEEADWFVVRMCLLDFIADFANWDNSTVPAYLETSRALTQAAHEALGGVPGTRPLVVDPFAGGGSIPLEALRVGADAFASDLNPVAVLLNKIVLEYIPKYGQRLTDEVRKWGQWVNEQAEKELAEFYPKSDDGAALIACLWARTVLSEAPGQEDAPIEIPLMRSLWLAKKPNRKVALRWRRDAYANVETEKVDVSYSDGTRRTVLRPILEVFVPIKDSEVEGGTVARGSATCPVSGHTTPVARVRAQLSSRRGGSADARMLVVVESHDSEDGASYRVPRATDLEVAANAARRLTLLRSECRDELSLTPEEETPIGGGRGAGRAFSQRFYGMDRFEDLFTSRQSLALATFARLVREAGLRLSDEVDHDPEFGVAVSAVLSMAVGKLADYLSSLCVWRTARSCVAHTFGRQALPITWDFGEMNPFAGSAGDWSEACRYLEMLLNANRSLEGLSGSARLASATRNPLPNDAADALITDPPYYDAVPYADLSDYFYVWLRRCLQGLHGSVLTQNVTPKSEELIMSPTASGPDGTPKDEKFFEESMRLAMEHGRRVVAPSGIGVVVFAHKTTEGWEALLQSLLDAGWTFTASWPIDTERPGRLRAQESAALASSVHLVCRPREDASGNMLEAIGEWREVLSELPPRIHEWMPRLASEGVVGADAIFACLGPALEIFSRYSRVEKASGELVPLREYLEHVWATVSTEALSMIFQDADAAGLEPDARLTAMWLWTLGGGTGKAAGGNGTVVPGLADDDTDDEPLPADKTVESTGYTLEFDAARKIAQGLGIHLERNESIVEVKGDKARLLPVSERTRHLFGKDDPAPSTARGRKKKKDRQRSLFEELDELEAEAEHVAAGELKPQAGETVLDRVHQSMILFAAGRGEALRRFLVDDAAGTDARFWKLAQSLSALYPKETDEKRWVDGVLARKKGLGL